MCVCSVKVSTQRKHTETICSQSVLVCVCVCTERRTGLARPVSLVRQTACGIIYLRIPSSSSPLTLFSPDPLNSCSVLLRLDRIQSRRQKWNEPGGSCVYAWSSRSAAWIISSEQACLDLNPSSGFRIKKIINTHITTGSRFHLQNIIIMCK